MTSKTKEDLLPHKNDSTFADGFHQLPDEVVHRCVEYCDISSILEPRAMSSHMKGMAESPLGLQCLQCLPIVYKSGPYFQNDHLGHKIIQVHEVMEDQEDLQSQRSEFLNLRRFETTPASGSSEERVQQSAFSSTYQILAFTDQMSVNKTGKFSIVNLSSKSWNSFRPIYGCQEQ